MAMEASAGESAVQGSGESKSRRARPRGLVTIFGTWCKGCGLCIEFCPQGVFVANGQGRPVVAYPEKCTACNWCETHCPDMAITVRRLEPDEVEEMEELADLAEKGALPGGEL
ncbi:MAG: ferredoxin family protein [Anaerolineae bacterium]|jgi:2-oxoglutarate ferredoxin oxidoreductase subunit delta